MDRQFRCYTPALLLIESLNAALAFPSHSVTQPPNSQTLSLKPDTCRSGSLSLSRVLSSSTTRFSSRQSRGLLTSFQSSTSYLSSSPRLPSCTTTGTLQRCTPSPHYLPPALKTAKPPSPQPRKLHTPQVHFHLKKQSKTHRANPEDNPRCTQDPPETQSPKTQNCDRFSWATRTRILRE